MLQKQHVCWLSRQRHGMPSRPTPAYPLTTTFVLVTEPPEDNRTSRATMSHSFSKSGPFQYRGHRAVLILLSECPYTLRPQA